MLPSLFISHGSPMLALQPGASGVALSQLAADLPKPTAILLVSAHWESSELRVSGARQPATLHDFGGFPAPLYQIQYPAPGSPALADQVVELLAEAGLVAQIDPTRPLDHGAWVPLSLLYPQADIPVVQLSLPSRLGPALQNRIGHCLSVLRRQGLLLIGLSFACCAAAYLLLRGLPGLRALFGIEPPQGRAARQPAPPDRSGHQAT